MAKEMMIVFIYDPTRCRREEDDPADAVLYFHPSWVSGTQRLALAGQLMGIHQFLSSSFSPPSLITLEGGKFVLKKFPPYIMAIGTDRNIQDWIIHRRADSLEQILKFFHCDLETISQSLNNDRTKFTERLYQMLETYLPILQYSSLFSSMPMIKLPKSASNVFLESLQLLQYCQETPGILGGAMFFNNKVVATQLSPELTKQLVITDPYRIKAPADRIPTSFHLPLGVQLLRVYVQRKPEEPPKPVYPLEPQIPKRFPKKTSLTSCGMKRDTSRIFTVPEEGEAPDGDPPEESVPAVHRRDSIPPKVESQVESKGEFRLKNRAHPLTPSVCSTPLRDINRVLHDTAVLICNADDSDEILDPPRKPQDIDDIPDVVKEALRCKRLNKLRSGGLDPEKKPRRAPGARRSSSVSDLEEWRPSSCTPESLHRRRYHSTTITDPCYPVFKFDGSPVSQELYDHYISSHYQELVKAQPHCFSESSRSSSRPSRTNGVDHQSLKDLDTTRLEFVESIPRDPSPQDPRTWIPDIKRRDTCRRSMSLPLKSLNAPAMIEEDGRRSSEVFEVKKKLEGLQLTPLMSRLSLLANDDKTSGFCSKETTPSEYYDLSTLSSRLAKNNNEEDDFWVGDREPGSGSVLEKAELFICGHQNMVMVLLMDDGTGNNPELIHSLWETCMNHLGRLESRLGHCMEPMPSHEHKELYSVLSVDPEWDTLHRSGLWGVSELEIAGVIHERFRKSRNLTDVIVRTEDTVVYGNQCGRTEVFYQQGVGTGGPGGLPTPADLMGVVPLKAKRRLERDHGIVIL
uniref:HPS4_1 protein n=1 Tax=Fopius arisanus TaxID=64838 RepID=A0A0C9RFL7_9HYME